MDILETEGSLWKQDLTRCKRVYCYFEVQLSLLGLQQKPGQKTRRAFVKPLRGLFQWRNT